MRLPRCVTPIPFFCTVALNVLHFQTKAGRRELGKIRYNYLDKSSTFFPTVGCTSTCCSIYSYQIFITIHGQRKLLAIYTDQEPISLDSSSGCSSAGIACSCSCSTTYFRFCAFGHFHTYIYVNYCIMLGCSDSGAPQQALPSPVATPVEQVMVRV